MKILKLTKKIKIIFLDQIFNDNFLIKIKIISGAGHHVYADKPKEFNDYVEYLFEAIDSHVLDN